MKYTHFHIGLLLSLSVQLFPVKAAGQDVGSADATEQYLEERSNALQKLQEKQSAYYKKLLRMLESDSLTVLTNSTSNKQQDKSLQKSADGLKNIYQFLTDQKVKLGSLPSSRVSDQLNEKLKDLESKIGERRSSTEDRSGFCKDGNFRQYQAA